MPTRKNWPYADARTRGGRITVVDAHNLITGQKNRGSERGDGMNEKILGYDTSYTDWVANPQHCSSVRATHGGADPDAHLGFILCGNVDSLDALFGHWH